MKVPSPIQYWDFMFPYTESYYYGKIEVIKTNRFTIVIRLSRYMEL